MLLIIKNSRVSSLFFLTRLNLRKKGCVSGKWPNQYTSHQNSCGIFLKIPEFREINSLKERITNPILINSLLKCRNDVNLTAVGDLNIRSHYQFSLVSVDDVSSDVPVRLLKDNAEIFADYICGFFNEFINSCKFPLI